MSMTYPVATLFREIMDECTNKEERWRIWRTFAFAFEGERLRRGIGGPDPVVWRKAAIDEGLGVPWQPFWNRLTDADLIELQDALSRSRIRT